MNDQDQIAWLTQELNTARHWLKQKPNTDHDRMSEVRNELSDLINTYNGEGVAASDEKLAAQLDKILDLLDAALSHDP